MNEPIQSYISVGLIHFMAYPTLMDGFGDAVGTARRILEDDYFDVMEITWIKDPVARAQIKALAEQAGVTLTYGAQPRLLRTGNNPNALDAAERAVALLNLKAGMDEAIEMGCRGYAFMSGKYDPAKLEEHYRALVDSTVELCSYMAQRSDMPVCLEVFDYDLDKMSLIGPVALTLRYAQEVSAKCPNFGLMVDLSHIPQLHESIAENLTPVAQYIRHAHMGNAVIEPGKAAFGDQHPRFGFPHSANGVTELADYLRTLIALGYLKKGQPRIVSFEVKPVGDEDPEMVIANAKRYLNWAWAQV